MASRNPIYVWDFTAPLDLEPEELMAFLTECAKLWVFQVEEGGETNFLHYQGKVSLKEKTRFPKFLSELGWHVSPSHSDGFHYVTKPETRIAGPYSNETYVDKSAMPIDIANFNFDSFYDFQKDIYMSKDVYEERKINFVFDPVGSNGKSRITRFMCLNKLARSVPPLNDYKDIMQYVCSFSASKMYIIDMPRALKKEKMGQFFAAIESLKGGYAYDTRHHGKEMWFDPPVIWIFSNYMPKLDLLSLDRWRFLKITEDHDFCEIAAA